MGGLKSRDPGTSLTIPNIRLVVSTSPTSGIPPMRRAFVLATTLGVLGCLALMPISAHAQQEGGRLPGARPTIEAIDFPVLQAAIDALPAEGGWSGCRPGRSRSTAASARHAETSALRGPARRRTSRTSRRRNAGAGRSRPATSTTDARSRIWRVRLANLRHHRQRGQRPRDRGPGRQRAVPRRRDRQRTRRRRHPHGRLLRGPADLRLAHHLQQADWAWT